MAQSRGVAQLIETLAMGGAEHLAVQLAGYLAAAGFESHLIVMRGPGELSERIDDRVRVHYLEYERASIRNPVDFMRSVLRGRALLHDRITDSGIALMQTHLPGANFWGLLLAARMKGNVVATVHNNQEFRYSAEDSATRVRLRKRAYGWLVRRCVATVAVSEAVKDSLRVELGLGPEMTAKIVVVPNGVAIPEPLSADAVESVRRQWGAPERGSLLVAAGRLGEQKNFGDLIAAAALLKRSGTRFRLIIAGEGAQRPALEREIERNDLREDVLMPGVVSELSSLFLAADLLVFPSLWEGLPLVLLEAMGAGLPVVGNRIDGVREIVQDGRGGRLVDPGNVEQLAEAIADALADPERLGAWGRHAREVVASSYSFENMGNLIAGLYRRVLEGSGGQGPVLR